MSRERADHEAKRTYHFRRSFGVVTTAATLTALVAGCASPGATPNSTSNSSSNSTKSVSTSVGKKPVTLNITVDTVYTAGFQHLGQLFHEKYPNVTVQVTGINFNTIVVNASHVLAGANPPDIFRVTSLQQLVKDHLVLNLDPYAKAYGWTNWSQSQFESTRLSANGMQVGTGSLYGVGPGFGVTGLFYNKTVASKLGITGLPHTLAELEADMAKAKAANYIPMTVDGKDGVIAFPLQNLQMDYAGGPTQMQNWIFDKPGANIDTPATIKAAQTIQQWYNNGYLQSDINSVDLNTSLSNLETGKALFLPSGNWSAPKLDGAATGKIGFFPFPSLNKSDPLWAMSAPYLVVVPAKDPNANVAVAFLNFTMTDPQARQDVFTQLGNAPAGPTNGSTPTASKGSSVADTLPAFKALLKSNGLVGFMANATPSMSVSTLFPEEQILTVGRTTPSAFAAALQSAYKQDLGGQ